MQCIVKVKEVFKNEYPSWMHEIKGVLIALVKEELVIYQKICRDDGSFIRSRQIGYNLDEVDLSMEKAS